MSIDLHKRAATAGIVLKKRGIENPPLLRVALIMDISGSFKGEYMAGHIQEVFTHLLGITMNFDPSHKLDVFVFDDDHAQLPVPATPDNYATYVDRQIINETEISKWGTTYYAGAIHLVMDHFFGLDSQHQEHRRGRGEIQNSGGGFFKNLFGRKTKPAPAPGPKTSAPDPAWAKIPVLAILVTDGDNDEDDHRPAEIAIQRSAPYPIFWSLVGVGHHSFRFLKQMDREFDDVEFINMENIRVSDENLYSQIVNDKLVRWLKQHPPGN